MLFYVKNVLFFPKSGQSRNSIFFCLVCETKGDCDKRLPQPLIRLRSPSFMTEHDLIQGCIREDRECQRELFNRYAGKMLTVTRRYARHQAEAEDLLQDTFVKVFNNLKKFEGKGSFEGWIRRIAVNTALKNYNKSSFKKEEIGLPEFHDVITDAEAVSNLTEEELLREIAALPEGYRLVFNLYVIEGYSHKEIAEALQIGESTSRSQLVKARKLLQEKLAHFRFVSLFGAWIIGCFEKIQL